MTVKELKKELEKFPDDWIILTNPTPGTFPPMPQTPTVVEQYKINDGKMVIIFPKNW